MIWIFNLERASAGSCDNYHDLFEYISQLQKLKPLDDHNKLEPHLDLPDSLCETMKKELCIEFCQLNNYTIVETPSQAMNFQESYWTPHFYSYDSTGYLEGVA